MTETWSWIDANGVSWPMNGFTAGIEVIEGAAGRHMPPIRRTRDVVAGNAGSRLRTVEHDTRTGLNVPIFVQASSEAVRAQLLRDWVHRFDPVRGPGILDVTSALGDHRRLTCIYSQGLEVVEDASNRFPGAQLAVLTFEADDPYWHPTSDDSTNFSLSSTPAVWFPGGIMLPIVLAASSVAGGTVVTVDSDVAVFPRWTITGPASAVVLTNESTGRSLIWNGTLAGGQTLTIDTRPGFKTVTREDGSNQFGLLTAWDMWPLLPGDNTINVSMSSTTGASAITETHTDAYLTP